MIIKSQLSEGSEFYFACLGAKVNGWNLQISDKRTTHLSENTKGGIESDRGGVPPRIFDRGVPRRFVNPNPI